MSSVQPDPAFFAAALSEVFRAINWTKLGSMYCHEGGEDFFPPEQVEAIQDAGLHFASDLGEALLEAPTKAGRSLYVGAAVAELPVALFDHLMLGREVVMVARQSPETTELNRALKAASKKVDRKLPRIEAKDLGLRENAPQGSFDHVWMVSVLTDPEAFPALHNRLYGRFGTELEVRGGNEGRERNWAARLVDQAMSSLVPPAWIFTTNEELELISEGADRAGLRLKVPDAARLSAIVGDPVYLCRVLRR
ncbi:MAG: hypothetical protein ACI841_001120 [Planctomycetota bacterium]|jgi:hypothetical protein